MDIRIALPLIDESAPGRHVGVSVRCAAGGRLPGNFRPHLKVPHVAKLFRAASCPKLSSPDGGSGYVTLDDKCFLRTGRTSYVSDFPLSTRLFFGY